MTLILAKSVSHLKTFGRTVLFEIIHYLDPFHWYAITYISIATLFATIRLKFLWTTVYFTPKRDGTQVVGAEVVCAAEVAPKRYAPVATSMQFALSSWWRTPVESFTGFWATFSIGACYQERVVSRRQKFAQHRTRHRTQHRIQYWTSTLKIAQQQTATMVELPSGTRTSRQFWIRVATLCWIKVYHCKYRIRDYARRPPAKVSTNASASTSVFIAPKRYSFFCYPLHIPDWTHSSEPSGKSGKVLWIVW